MADDDPFQMSFRHREAIRKNYVFLTSQLEVNSDILSYLIQESVLVGNMVEEIENAVGRANKARRLLEILPRRGPTAMKTFIEALIESHQGHIAERLDGQLAEIARRTYMDTINPKPPLNQGGHVSNEISATDRVDHPPTMRNEECYPMTLKPRGKAVIINIEKVKGMTKRQGSSHDVDSITKLFEELHFEIDVQLNKTVQEITDHLKKVSTELNDRAKSQNKYCDAFVLVLMSHGTRGHIYAADGLGIPLEALSGYFDGKQCPALRNKPKVFLIQACRGSEDASRVQHDGPTDSEDNTDSPSVMAAEVLQKILPKSGHQQSDMLFFYSTVEGFKSYREKDHGSWFIQTFVNQLRVRARSDHLKDIITEVIDIVHEKSTKENDFVQLPEERSTFRKKLYFRPDF